MVSPCVQVMRIIVDPLSTSASIPIIDLLGRSSEGSSSGSALLIPGTSLRIGESVCCSPSDTAQSLATMQTYLVQGETISCRRCWTASFFFFCNHTPFRPVGFAGC
jgi:hypothetical protein